EIAAVLQVARIGAVLVGPAGLVTIAFGLWLVHIEHVGYGAGWIDAALVLFVAAGALGGFAGRKPRRARELAERGQDPRVRRVELDAGGGRVLLDLLRPRGADDRGRDARLPQHPRERELRHRDPEAVRDRTQSLHRFEHIVVAEAVHRPAHLRRGGARPLGRPLAGRVLASEDALGERRPDDL